MASFFRPVAGVPSCGFRRRPAAQTYSCSPAYPYLLYSPFALISTAAYSPLVNEPGLSRNQRDFLRIVQFATAFAFGVTAGSHYALEQTGSGFVLRFSFGVIPAFLAGAAIGWSYWHLILRRAEQTGAKRFRIYSWVLVAIGLACFLYPIRYVKRGALSDVVQGVLMAFVLVGVIGVLLWLVARLLNAPDREKQDH